MLLSKQINKISWTLADKLTFALYGIASIILLKATNNVELGLFTLFNNLHNFILSIATLIGLQSLLHFSSDKKNIPLINFYSFFNCLIIVTVFSLLFFLLQTPISNLLNEFRFTIIAYYVTLLSLVSVPRYFIVYIFYRELEINKLFIMNLFYFGIMSGIIFYKVWLDFFITYTDLIEITFIGSIISTIIGLFLSRKFWKFQLPTKKNVSVSNIKYKEVLLFVTKYSLGGISSQIPRVLDVYLIQFFFNINVVGLYAPAKTIFRFIEDLINAVNTTIYSPIVKSFSNNDIKGVNSIATKSISLLVIFFLCVTLVCWIWGEGILSIFLSEKFISAIPIFNYLMFTSIFLPFTILNVVVNANGLPLVASKYIIVSIIFWFISFVIIGEWFNYKNEFVVIPYLVYAITFSVLFIKYSYKHYQFKIKQIFRFFSDGIGTIKIKL